MSNESQDTKDLKWAIKVMGNRDIMTNDGWSHDVAKKVFDDATKKLGMVGEKK